MDVYFDQIMTKSQAPSAFTYVSNLINEILENKGWKGFQSQEVPSWYSNGTKFSFKDCFYKWKKDNRIVTCQTSNPWIIHPQDNDIIITDLLYKDSISLWPEFFGFYYCDFEYVNNAPTKKINYLTNRVENSRLKILYQLYNLSMIDQCNISLNGLQQDNSIAKLLEHHEDCPAQDFFKNKMPFRNWSGSLEQSILNCEITLVHETSFDQPMKLLTEKTFRVLQLPRPFVIFGASGIINWLKEMGFDVGEKYVDHSYDSIKDHNKRREAVLLSSLNFKWDESMLKEYETIANNNQQILKKYREEFENKLKTVLEKL
jgi:hypothetical protein